MKIIAELYAVTGKYGVAPGDKDNYREQVIEGDSLQDIKQQIDEIRKNWTGIRGLYIEHPDNADFRQKVIYDELFADVIAAERPMDIMRKEVRRWYDAAQKVGLDIGLEGITKSLSISDGEMGWHFIYAINSHELIWDIDRDFLYDASDDAILKHSYEIRQRILDEIDGKADNL